MGIGFAGCETAGSMGSLFSGSLFGSSTPAPEIAAPAPVAPQPPLARVSVAPIIGAPDAIAKQIQQEFTSAVEKQRVTVISNKDERADFTLRGYIVAAKDKANTKVSYIWDVTDPAGKRVNRITGEEVVTANAGKDPWAALTPQVAQSIAGKAAGSFVAWLPTQSAPGRSDGLQRASAAFGHAAGRRRRRPSAPPPPSNRRRQRRRRAASPATVPCRSSCPP